MDAGISKRATKAVSRKATHTPIVRKGPKTAKKQTPHVSLQTRKNTHQARKTETFVHKYSEIGLQDLAILLFGEDAVRDVKDKMDVREIWNISTNTTQCNNVIGKSNAETECWICGLKIAQLPGMTPECEHILPVAQAVIYLSLYSSKKPNSTNAEKKVLEMEYGWAHSICNQDKSDICCIINNGQNAVVSYGNIQYILNKIYNSNRTGSHVLKQRLEKKFGSQREFMKARFDAVKKRYQQIVDFLNPTSGENRFKLTILAGLVTAMDYTNIHDKAQSLLSDEFRAQRESEKEMLTNLLTDEIKEDIFENFTIGGLEGLANIGTIVGGIGAYFNSQKRHFLGILLTAHRAMRAQDKIPDYENEIDKIDEGWNLILTNAPVIETLTKLYPQLYVKLVLMFIDPDK